MAPRTCGAAGDGGPCNAPATHVTFGLEASGGWSAAEQARAMDACEPCARAEAEMFGVTFCRLPASLLADAAQLVAVALVPLLFLLA